MATQPLAVEVHPVALFGDDVILRDPDHPDTDVTWTITKRGSVDGVVVIEYRTDDEVEGRHSFDDPTAWITVAVHARQAGAAA